MNDGSVEEVTQQAATAIRAQVTAEERHRRLDLDVRGLIALIALTGGFILAFAQLWLKGNADIPAWASATVAGVIGFYFGAKGGGSNGGAAGGYRSGDA